MSLFGYIFKGVYLGRVTRHCGEFTGIDGEFLWRGSEIDPCSVGCNSPGCPQVGVKGLKVRINKLVPLFLKTYFWMDFSVQAGWGDEKRPQTASQEERQELARRRPRKQIRLADVFQSPESFKPGLSDAFWTKTRHSSRFYWMICFEPIAETTTTTTTTTTAQVGNKPQVLGSKCLYKS